MDSYETTADHEHKLIRKTFSQEFKLNAISWFYKNVKSIPQTVRRFGIDRKTMWFWLRISGTKIWTAQLHDIVQFGKIETASKIHKKVLVVS